MLGPIYLCVCFRAKGSSKNLFPDLIKNGVVCDLRKLHVGDILWIAREKVPHRPGTGGSSVNTLSIVEKFNVFSNKKNLLML